MSQLIAPKVYNLIQEVEKFANGSGKIALHWKDDSGNEQKITYDVLLNKTNKIASSLLSLGLQKGDRILIMMPRLIDTYIYYLGGLKAGLVIIPSSEMLRSKDISYRLNHSEAKAIVSYHTFTEQLEQVEDDLPYLKHKIVVGQNVKGWISEEKLLQNATSNVTFEQTDRDDMAFLSYTSGTTGQPKGVVHTHGWAYAHLHTAAEKWLGIKESDVVWATAGPGWQKWIWSPFLSVLGSGATGFVYQGKFNPETYLNLLENHQVNVLCCTPTEYRLMAKVDHLQDYNLQDLRSAVSAGEPLNREVIDTFKKYFNVTVRDGYGQTENTLLIGIVEGMEVRPGSMGKPTPGNQVEIVDEDGHPVKTGDVGDIAVHKDAPALFREYFKDEERTQRSFRGDYYITGDKAKKDEDGYFWFEGRSDDIIISSGYTIGPFEVEDALVKHTAVKECAVVASPDQVRGSLVKAFVILQDSVEPSEQLIKDLQDHVKTLTAPYKYPRKIEFVSDLPKTTSGKIRRIELRQNELKTQKA